MKSKIAILIITSVLLLSKLNAQYLTFTVIPASCSSCCDGSFTLDVTYCSTSIDFTSNSLTVTINGGHFYTYHNVCPGNYAFYTLQSELCAPVSQTFTMPFATNVIEKNNALEILSIFPNPISNKLYFGLNKYDNKFDLSIFSAYGECVFQNPDADLNQSLDVSFLKAGVYFVNIQNQFSQKTIKVIKEE